jgi:spore germination protein GerM
MKHARVLAVAVVVTSGAALVWLLFVGLPRWYAPQSHASAAPAAAPSVPGRKIKARLFYVGENGTRLTSVERDVPYGENPTDQARQIVEAQLAPAEAPLISAVPAGTELRALFIDSKSCAYVDLSGEVVSAHPGGSTDELLTVYTIVDALTANLPAISGVQLLVNGKEVETLAGHVDLRRPLTKDLEWAE